MNANIQQSFADIAQLDIDYYTLKNDAAGVEKAKENLQKAQEELSQHNNQKAEYERELSYLKATQYR